MIPSRGPSVPKVFRYARYNAELTVDGLRAIGCGDIDPEDVQKLDSIAAISDLLRIGKIVSERQVAREHFNCEVFKP
jgi:uncharacterized protein